jgi:predicted dehydrogenase
VPTSKRITRYAVVGLGHIAQAALLPAFAHARRNSRLTAVVSGDRTKRREIAKAVPTRPGVQRRQVR